MLKNLHFNVFYCVTALFLTMNSSFLAQDIYINNAPVPSPVSGCNLTSNTPVAVSISNAGPTAAVGGSITMRHRVDNTGPIITQVIGPPLLSGGNINITFATGANLSVCGPHIVKVWVQKLGDPNPLNDTLTINIQNDCTIVPGTISASIAVVCTGSNSGTVTLSGMQNGTIVNWESSTGGLPFQPLSPVQNTSTINFNNLTANTSYRVLLEGGFCPDVYSGIGTVLVTQLNLPGVLSGSTAVCSGTNAGTVSLAGNTGAIEQWEFNENNTSWSTTPPSTVTIGTTSIAFLNLLLPLQIRSIVGANVCPDVYTNEAVITVDAITVPGILSQAGSACVGDTFQLSLSGNVGSIIDWSIFVGSVWVPLNNPNSNTYALSGQTGTTFIRVLVDNDACDADVSNVIGVTWTNPINNDPGVLTNQTFLPPNPVLTTSVCSSSSNVNLYLNNATIPVQSWIASINGSPWANITNVDNFYLTSNQIGTNNYRVILDGGACPDDTSNIFSVIVFGPSVGGNLPPNSSVCAGSPVSLTLTGYTGQIMNWESNPTGALWIPVAPVANSVTYTPPTLTTTTRYRVLVKNGTCNSIYSGEVTITVLPYPAVSAGADAVIIEGESVNLSGVGTGIGTWSPFSEFLDSSQNTQTVSPLILTEYYYTVVGSNGCSLTDTVKVTVLPADPPLPDSVNIKNVITANGDGFNDTWMIDGLIGFPSTYVIVHNAYGQEVFSSPDYKNDWKGDFQGKDLPNGTYFYTVILGVKNEKYQGTITILGR